MYCGARGYVEVVAAVRVVVVHVACWVEAAAFFAVLTVIVVDPVVVVTAVGAFCVGIAHPASPDPATGIQCCLMPCHVVDVAAVVLLPLTLSVRRRGHRCGKGCHR